MHCLCFCIASHHVPQRVHTKLPIWLVQVVGVAHTFVEVWEGVAALLAEMDVLLGFAEVAVNAPTPYVRPQMLPPDDGELKLVGCRFVQYPHPLL